MKNNRQHIFFLFIAALFWGTTFVAQSIGADHVEPFTYLMSRSWIAVVFLTPVIHVLDKNADAHGRDNRRPRNAEERKKLLFAGLICGTALCMASFSQQLGIAYTTTAKASFLTALYVVLVPIFSILIKKKPPVQIWVCVLISLTGLYLLCIKGGDLTLEFGDGLELLCAALFSCQIMLVDHFVPQLDGVRLSRLQFLVVAIESTVLMLIFEKPAANEFMLAIPAICYAGIFSSGIAYTLQIVGQDEVNPTVASLVMSLESVFGTLSGWIVLGEALNGREIFGCVLMFSSIVLAQIPVSEIFYQNKD